MKVVCEEHVEPKTFLQKYMNEDATIMEYFEYPLNTDGLIERYEDVNKRSYDRSGLIEALKNFNAQFTDDKDTFSQIDRIKMDNSVVVVGGQQAGLLTGPIYTINKIISIIHEASVIERELNVPVVPIFWIAGEDHDIDEVNHTYFHQRSTTRKLVLKERNDLKIPVSNRQIRMEEGKQLINEGLKFLKETPYIKKLYESLMNDLKEDVTYVDWFAKIIHRIFKGTGLVLMDAADINIRKLEKPYFKEMLENNDEIRSSFYEVAKKFKDSGFGEPIEIDKSNAHLFVHDQGQRFLLEKDGAHFREKNSGRKWIISELLEKLEGNPDHFSNNVVTRPVMQDKLLPVISFVAGPGELKYWATLKKVFHSSGITMPLVYPRVQIAFLSRRTEKNLAWMNKSPHDVTMNGVESEKIAWRKENTPIEISDPFDKLKKEMEKSLDNLATELQPLGDLQFIHERQREIIANDLILYEKRINKYVENHQMFALKKFDEVAVEIKPEGNLQERYLNILPFLNQYGPDAILGLLKDLHKEKTLVGKFLYVYL
ncbi:bacillithiol biosynthesis cysteine-adding enzyme BshC [Evansella cellulosilytica]|uniref:Putative cysteine ligase BshC n=1 Tax=Evansella cellulosilytica (strain ATCC 21833 / DSM 2522 / FERM P-1141 / JCM 9156 / N-4) TaxID=649639 RepID=E6TTU0_EVAC2|nr:bacillithiol biosynthesis cysteine-adding enzyme BshC [Evansella cellulosilytica]ADU30859.1 protein of unknown function UCP012535 [Evansella cellulosilytica DSM 2522]